MSLCPPQIQYVLLFSRQGKVRLQKWFHAFPQKEKKKIQRELVSTILSRKSKMCNILEYKETKVVYKRYGRGSNYCSSTVVHCTHNLRIE